MDEYKSCRYREIHVDGLVVSTQVTTVVRCQIGIRCKGVFSSHFIHPGLPDPSRQDDSPILGCRLLDYFGKLSFCKRPNCLKESSKHHLLLINQTINKKIMRNETKCLSMKTAKKNLDFDQKTQIRIFSYFILLYLRELMMCFPEWFFWICKTSTIIYQNFSTHLQSLVPFKTQLQFHLHIVLN